MRKLIFVSLLLIVFFISEGDNILAQGLQFDGFLESYYSIRLKEEHDFIGERSRLRLNLRNSSKDIYMFAALNGVSNGIMEDDGLEVDIHEAYVEYTQPLWDVKIGRQIYSWGKADGVRITDVLSPCDYSEYISRDFDEIRIPVDSLRYRYLFPMVDLELVWIPSFTEGIYPKEKDNPWYVSRYENVTINPAVEVEDKLGNSELAARLSFYLSGVDFSLSTAYLWDDEPAYHKTGFNIFTPEYHRLRFYGFDLSKPVKDFVFRFESAYYRGKYFSANNSCGLLKRNYIHSLAGIDWYPGNNWTVTTQLASKHIIDYERDIKNDENQTILTLNLNKKFLRETLELANMVYYETDERDGFNRFSIDYAVNDNLHFLTGIDYFFGTEGEFANYDDNDSLWVKVKYDF